MNEFARFAQDLARAAVGIDSMAEAAELRAARGALETARAVAPVDKGDLRASLRIVRRKSGGVSVEATSEAAPYQEYGTSVMAPNPYILPAVDRWGPQLVRDVEGICDEVVRRLT